MHKSLKIWSLYADLEESFGTFKTAKSVYDRILELKIATPQIIINYGLFLKENNYFEEAFKAYEKGIAMFKWPNVFDIWNTYLTEFLERYGGKKIERTRDLFEQCLETCPSKFAKRYDSKKDFVARWSVECFVMFPCRGFESFGTSGLTAHSLTFFSRNDAFNSNEESFMKNRSLPLHH